MCPIHLSSLRMLHPSEKYSLVRQVEKILKNTSSLVESCYDVLAFMTIGSQQRINKLKTSCTYVNMTYYCHCYLAFPGSVLFPGLENIYHNKRYLDSCSYIDADPSRDCRNYSERIQPRKMLLCPSMCTDSLLDGR